MSNIDPDAEVVERAKNAPEGDLRAFETLVRKHESDVKTNCRYLTRSQDDAEDLAQEVFVKVFFGLRRFEGRSTFQSWVRRIKVNHCLNYVRGRRDEEHVDIDDEVARASPALAVGAQAECDLENAHRAAVIRSVLDAMPETLRLALILRDLDELSYQEVADTLGVGLSAAKMRIKRARTDFRERFTQVMSEDAAVWQANERDGGDA